MRVDSSSPLAGKTLGEAAIRQSANVIVLGLKPADGSLLFNPTPETRIRAGDTLIVMGGDAQLKRLESLSGGI